MSLVAPPTPPPTPTPNPFDEIYNMYNNSITNSSSILAKQDYVNKILDDETTLLENKKQGVDDYVKSQDRMVNMNSSYQKRLNQWAYVIIAIIVFIIVIIVFLQLQKDFPFFSEYFDLILATVLGLFIIYLLITINSIRSRTNTDFDEVIMAPPLGAGKPRADLPIKKEGSSFFDGLGGNMTCIGSTCCDNVTSQYDATLNKCISLACIKNGQLVDMDGNCISQKDCSANPDTKICGDVCVSAATTCVDAVVESFVSGQQDAGITPLYTQQIKMPAVRKFM